MKQTRGQRLLRRGVAAAKAENRDRARSLLLDSAREEPHSELTWLWLASVAETSDEAIQHLERALAINPFNQRARTWLVKLRDRVRYESAGRSIPVQGRRSGRRGSQVDGPRPARSPWRCPFCEQDFVARPIRCVRCGSVQSLQDLGAFFDGVDVDTDRLRAAVTRLRRGGGAGGSVARHKTLGLALLNLRRYREALIYLSAAAALAPYDAGLGEAAYGLMRRLNGDEERKSGDGLESTVAITSDPSCQPA